MRGLPLDVYGQMGLLVLVSLAAKNGILIVEFANQRLAEGMELEAAIHGAALARVRPILLTAISSLAGFLPLLFARGAGAASRISIGTVVFSGLLVATVLTLFVVPVIYRLVKGWELRRRQRHPLPPAPARRNRPWCADSALLPGGRPYSRSAVAISSSSRVACSMPSRERPRRASASRSRSARTPGRRRRWAVRAVLRVLMAQTCT